MTVQRTLDDWLAFYEQLHPVGIDLGLARVRQVWAALCQQYQIQKIAKRVITVAGTNGKGSTCQMLSSLLQRDNAKVGVYSSPHIHRFNERIKINDLEIDDNEIIRAFYAIEAVRGSTTLSYFEATTLAGLLIFAWQKVDEAILEVGLGGRLDAINIIDADAVIITSIAQDHENFLGNDLSQIALEKAGVCRANTPAVYAQSEVYDSVLTLAEDLNVSLIINGRDYEILAQTANQAEGVVFQENHYPLPEAIINLGYHQVQNASAAIVLLLYLHCLPEDYALRLSGFYLNGRLQKVSQSPDVIVDVAHNEEAAIALAQVIRKQRKEKRYHQYYAVMGMLKDKEHDKVFSALTGLFDGFYFADTHGERGFSARQLNRIYQHQKVAYQAPSMTFTSLTLALEKAQSQANQHDVIYAFGSFLVVEALT